MVKTIEIYPNTQNVCAKFSKIGMIAVMFWELIDYGYTTKVVGLVICNDHPELLPVHDDLVVQAYGEFEGYRRREYITERMQNDS